MHPSPDHSNLRIELDTKRCEFTADETRRLETSLSPLRKLLVAMPVADLFVTVYFHPQNDAKYQVKTALALSGKTLFSSDTDAHWHPAFERCVSNLVQQVEAYKDALANGPELARHRKGASHEVVPSREPDADAIAQAVASADYAAFRQATFPYDESLRQRVGRWVGRYSEIQEQIGDEFAIADLVEAVFLNAFDEYENRPMNLRLGQWLENLIDRSLKELSQNPDELQNVRFARTLREWTEQPDSGA